MATGRVNIAGAKYKAGDILAPENIAPIYDWTPPFNKEVASHHYFVDTLHDILLIDSGHLFARVYVPAVSTTNKVAELNQDGGIKQYWKQNPYHEWWDVDYTYQRSVRGESADSNNCELWNMATDSQVFGYGNGTYCVKTYATYVYTTDNDQIWKRGPDSFPTIEWYYSMSELFTPQNGVSPTGLKFLFREGSNIYIVASGYDSGAGATRYWWGKVNTSTGLLDWEVYIDKDVRGARLSNGNLYAFQYSNILHKYTASGLAWTVDLSTYVGETVYGYGSQKYYDSRSYLQETSQGVYILAYGATGYYLLLIDRDTGAHITHEKIATSTSPYIAGLAVINDRLYVANGQTSAIEVYSIKTLTGYTILE